MDYNSCLKRLYQVNELGSVKFGLQNSQRLQEALGFPEKNFSIVHVAGTNGKGSVATKIAKGLELTGKKTGLYTSPHISSFQERIQINGTPISKKSLTKHLEKLFKIVDSLLIPASFFELTTLLCFLYFKEQQVDWAVIETGLGGRLDATNIIENPKLCVITSISYDHTEILGNSLEAIAKEKAGILKKNCQVLIGPSVPKEIILETALPLQLDVTQVTGSFSSFDEENQAIAKKALQFLSIQSSIVEKAVSFRPPCRMEEHVILEKKVIFDVAHNPDGIGKLFLSLRHLFPTASFRIVAGFSESKDISSCLDKILQYTSSIHLVTSSHPRIASKKVLQKLSFLPVYDSVLDGIQEAFSLLKKQEILVILGSFFIMDEAKNLIIDFEQVLKKLY